jgi:hypothetical protein
VAENALWPREERSDPAFGDLLAAYLEQRSMSQGTFAQAMKESGYQGPLKRGMVSHIVKHPQTRVYSDFFEHAQKVLGLTDRQANELVLAWAGLKLDLEAAPINREAAPICRVDLKITLA